MSSETTIKEIFAEVQAEEIWNYDDETFDQLWKPFKKIVTRWLQRKQQNNWLKGSLGYEIIEELMRELE